MSEDFMEEKNSKEDSFADLLEAYSDGMKEDLQLGDKLKGKIISIGRESIFVDTGTKIDGVVDREELLDENRELSFKEGDTLELYVVFNNGNEIRLSKTLSGMGKPFEKPSLLKGRSKESVREGFMLKLWGKGPFVPSVK